MVKVVDQVLPLVKRKRFNKNKKKAWRKKANISEVEDNLEEERRVERYGGPLEEKDDTEMLFLDVGDDGGGNVGPQPQKDVKECTLEYTVDEIPEDSGSVKLKPRKVKRKVKTLKSHQFINGLQGAKAPRKLRKNQGTLSVAMKKKEQRQAKDPRLIKKYGQVMKQIAENAQKNVVIPKGVIKTKYAVDIWGDGADDVVQECKKKGLEESFIGDISKYYKTQRKLQPVKVPKCRLTPTSKLDAVQIPHAGASYNPSFESHQKLLHKALGQEESSIRKLKRVERATTKMFPTVDKAPSEQTWLVEMSEGLPHDDEDAEAAEGQENTETQDNITVSSKPKNERKTKKIRRKEKKQKLAKLKKIQQKEERIRSSNIFKVKSYQKEIEKSEELTRKRVAGRLARKEQLKYKPHRLGGLRFEEEEIPVQLGDELPDCLRRMTPGVELLEDRFRNLQRRNLLEARLPHKMKRKYKVKIALKRGHREEMEKLEKMQFAE